MRQSCAAFALTVALGLLTATVVPLTAATSRPKLVVVLVIDQMRADYIDRFGADWTGGLKRLVTQGAVFTEAAYPYLDTVTCAGHATVMTGTFPHLHGIMQNTWWDRETAHTTTCTEDARTVAVGYGVGGRTGDSPFRLQVPTFTDLLRAERGAHVVSLSFKADSAIMLAGHGADAVTWFDAQLNSWQTSSAYGTERVPAVQQFASANPVTADFGKTWDRLLPVSRYLDPDDGLAEAPPAGWTRTFPHVLTGVGGMMDVRFFTQWLRSPYADAYLGRFAASLTADLQLGRHAGTDVLAVGFSTPDYVGHAFGPRSQEEQDIYARLDGTIGTLLERLDMLVGRGQYVVAMTADHGVTSIPEQRVAAGQDAGRLNSAAIRNVLEQQLRGTLGGKDLVANVGGGDIYLSPGVYDTLRASPEATAAAVAALAALPGVQRVFTADDLRGQTASADPVRRAAALSYVAGRSGDLIIAPKPGWMFSASGTTHGTANADDQRVPIVLWGQGIKPGRYAVAATPADIAPTLAALVHLTMPGVEGHALRVAIR